MLDEFMTFVEEDFVFCLRCQDTGWITEGGKEHPCHECNPREYRWWRDEQVKMVREDVADDPS